jgi:hypothetical protein
MNTDNQRYILRLAVYAISTTLLGLLSCHKPIVPFGCRLAKLPYGESCCADCTDEILIRKSLKRLIQKAPADICPVAVLDVRDQESKNRTIDTLLLDTILRSLCAHVTVVDPKKVWIAGDKFLNHHIPWTKDQARAVAQETGAASVLIPTYVMRQDGISLSYRLVMNNTVQASITSTVFLPKGTWIWATAGIDLEPMQPTKYMLGIKIEDGRPDKKEGVLVSGEFNYPVKLHKGSGMHSLDSAQYFYIFLIDANGHVKVAYPDISESSLDTYESKQSPIKEKIVSRTCKDQCDSACFAWLDGNPSIDADFDFYRTKLNFGDQPGPVGLILLASPTRIYGIQAIARQAESILGGSFSIDGLNSLAAHLKDIAPSVSTVHYTNN